MAHAVEGVFTMAISSAGIGSGLDVAKIVEQTVAAEKTPLKKLETKAEGIQTQISTYGEIKSLTSKLDDSVSKLTRDSAWNGVNISASNSISLRLISLFSRTRE